jgi:hypothetical protein
VVRLFQVFPSERHTRATWPPSSHIFLMYAVKVRVVT